MKYLGLLFLLSALVISNVANFNLNRSNNQLREELNSMIEADTELRAAADRLSEESERGIADLERCSQLLKRRLSNEQNRKTRARQTDHPGTSEADATQ